MKNIMIILMAAFIAFFLFITVRTNFKDNSNNKSNKEVPVDIRKINFNEYSDVHSIGFEPITFSSYKGSVSLTFQHVLDKGITLDGKDLKTSWKISGLGFSANENGQQISNTYEDKALMYSNLNELEGIEVLDEICFPMLNVDGSEMMFEVPECYFLTNKGILKYYPTKQGDFYYFYYQEEN